MMFFSLSFFACVSNAQDADIELAFEQLFGDLFEANEPGGSILVMKGDDVKYLGNFGLADIESGEKINEHTLFNTGSISKTFVSNAILILHERNKLSIKDPISKYFKDFEKKDVANSITIEHLLSHTSGLPDIRNVGNNRNYFLTAKDRGNWNPIKRTSELNFEPGAEFEYSNPAFNGLALIIEEVSGEKWQDFVQREIFNVAGMKTSTITDGSHPQDGVAHGYDYKHYNFVESDYGEVPTFAAAGNGGIWSTVKELALYEKALLEHQVLSKELLEESRQVHHPSNWASAKKPNIGYSWFVDVNSRFLKDPSDVKVVYHTGSQGGFRSFYISIPEKDLLYVALFNRPFSAYAMVMQEGLKILKDANWLDE